MRHLVLVLQEGIQPGPWKFAPQTFIPHVPIHALLSYWSRNFTKMSIIIIRCSHLSFDRYLAFLCGRKENPICHSCEDQRQTQQCDLTCRQSVNYISKSEANLPWSGECQRGWSLYEEWMVTHHEWSISAIFLTMRSLADWMQLSQHLSDLCSTPAMAASIEASTNAMLIATSCVYSWA